jgi:hypothetical protein
MGGDDYDRPVPSYSSTSYQTSGSGAKISNASAKQVSQNREPDPGVLVRNRKIFSDSESVVVIFIDDSGSMGEDASLLHGKMPMVVREIKGYLNKPAVCIGMIGDADGDSWPVQITDPIKIETDQANVKAGEKIDKQMKDSLHIEKGGGGQGNESYELAGYFVLNKCDFSKAKQVFVFFLGDEGFYPQVLSGQIQDFIGDRTEDMDSFAMWNALKKKANVFRIHRKYNGGSRSNSAIVSDWEKALGKDHVFLLDDVNAVADLILAAIALVGAKRSKDQYLVDMKNRDQTPKRIAEVAQKIEALSESLAMVPVNAIPARKDAGAKRASKSERL